MFEDVYIEGEFQETGIFRYSLFFAISPKGDYREDENDWPQFREAFVIINVADPEGVEQGADSSEEPGDDNETPQQPEENVKKQEGHAANPISDEDSKLKSGKSGRFYFILGATVVALLIVSIFICRCMRKKKSPAPNTFQLPE